MKEEIGVAVQFLSRLIEKNNGSNKDNSSSSNNKEVSAGIDKEQLEVFKERLGELLCERFRNHWFPEKPARGQGFRCIRLNQSDRKDPVIESAAVQCGLTYEQLRLPAELTIWVDPKEVCCRFGEHQGSFCTLASFKNGNGEIYLDSVNIEEINKKNLELREKIAAEMGVRKNGRRGFLSNGSSPNNYKGSRYNGGGMNNQHTGGFLSAHHHSGGAHHAPTRSAGLHPTFMHTPSPAAMSWYQSVNGGSSTNSNGMNPHNGGHMNGGNPYSDMFSTSPPNHPYSMYNKPSPPNNKFMSKWSAGAGNNTAHGPWMPGAKSDKYHWFNSTKPTIKA